MPQLDANAATAEIHSELSTEIDALDTLAYDLGQAVDGLHSKLDPVLRPVEPSPGEVPKATSCATTPLTQRAGALRDIHDRLKAIYDRVSTIANRLEV